jgi:hypothetical protein
LQNSSKVLLKVKAKSICHEWDGVGSKQDGLRVAPQKPQCLGSGRNLYTRKRGEIWVVRNGFWWLTDYLTGVLGMWIHWYNEMQAHIY